MVRTLAALALTSAVAGAQSLSDVPTMWDLTAGVGSGAVTVSAAGSRATYLGTSDKLRAGIGLRTTLVAGTLDLDPQDPRGIGPHDDYLTTATSTLLVNVGFNLGYEFNRRVMGGMNIDLFGITLGTKQNAMLTPEGGGSTSTIPVKPASPNIFKGGSDQGSLNSEFFLQWTLSDRYAVRGGLSHQLVSMKFAESGTIGGSSATYYKFANLLFVGLRITPPQ